MSYQHDPAMAPDSDFQPGRLEHLVAGNACRLLDVRRMPLRVVGVRAEIATFSVEVMAFEDAGATWDLAFEDVARLQFVNEATLASAAQVATFRDAIERVGGHLDIVADPDQRADTESRLVAERGTAATWFGSRRPGLEPSSATGSPELAADLTAYLAARDLADVEAVLTSTYVSNPGSGDVVRAHAVVVAELGLAEYHGPALRDPDALTGRFDRDRRAEHVLARLGFVSTAFRIAGWDEVVLYRGMSFEHVAVVPRPAGPFVSATFHRPIAEALSALGPRRRAGVLLAQRVPVDRLFMTHHETAAMNTNFQEAEAVLLADPAALF